MKRFILLSCLFVLACKQDKKFISSFEHEVRSHQEALNKQFKNEIDSPLTEEDFKSFQALEFYPADESFKVRAKLTFHPDSKPFPMKTTTSRLPIYRHYATASFELQGKSYQLELYQNQQLLTDPTFREQLFLPFTDLSNGNGSYGGGRYIDLEIPEGDEIVIDFNQSYNPYCAYNKKYSCPVPPEVNHMDVAIVAGIKAYSK